MKYEIEIGGLFRDTARPFDNSVEIEPVTLGTMCWVLNHWATGVIVAARW